MMFDRVSSLSKPQFPDAKPETVTAYYTAYRCDDEECSRESNLGPQAQWQAPLPDPTP